MLNFLEAMLQDAIHDRILTSQFSCPNPVGAVSSSWPGVLRCHAHALIQTGVGGDSHVVRVLPNGVEPRTGATYQGVMATGLPAQPSIRQSAAPTDTERRGQCIAIEDRLWYRESSRFALVLYDTVHIHMHGVQIKIADPKRCCTVGVCWPAIACCKPVPYS